MKKQGKFKLTASVIEECLEEAIEKVEEANQAEKKSCYIYPKTFIKANKALPN